MTVRLPWGKHRGKPVDEVPISYLVWVLTECDNVSPYLEEACFERIREWLEEETGRSVAEPNGTTRNASALIASWFRQMSKEFHPDRSGTNEAMRAVNRGYELLQQLFGND